MTRRFIIATGALTPPDELTFAQFLSSTGGSWWHWVDNFWLFATNDSEISAAGIRDWLNGKGNTQKVSLVLEIHPDITWALVTQKKESDTVSKWLETVWAKEEEPGD